MMYVSQRLIIELLYDSPENKHLEALCYRTNLFLIGLLWTKQFYHYVMDTWVEGDPTQIPPPESRRRGRNAQDWEHLYNREVISMPDKWEYPWVSYM